MRSPVVILKKYMLLPKENRKNQQYGFEIVGPPGTGKSIFTDFLFDIIFPDLTYRPLPDFLNKSNRNVKNLSLVNMANHRAVVFTEPIIQNESESEYLKVLIGNNTVTGWSLYENTVTYKIDSIILLVSNYPILNKFSHIKGLNRRIVSIPFTNVPKYNDENLLSKLTYPKEKALAFHWAIEGIECYLNNPIITSKKDAFIDEVQNISLDIPPVLEFSQKYLQYTADLSKKEAPIFPYTSLKLIFKFFYESEVNGIDFAREVKKYFPPYVTIKTGRDGRKYYTHLWIKRAFLYSVFDYIYEKKLAGLDDNPNRVTSLKLYPQQKNNLYM
nr:hypothetical protein [Sahlingia subintegra]